MKRLLFPAVVVSAAIFAVVPLATAKTEPTSAEATLRAVCHRTSSSTRTTTPVTLIDEIAANPSAFYVNVHTTDRPAGAVRGQLG